MGGSFSGATGTHSLESCPTAHNKLLTRAQRRTHRLAVERDARKLRLEATRIKTLENSTTAKLRTANRRAQRGDFLATQAKQEVRSMAREIAFMRKQRARVETQEAMLRSVGRQVDHALAERSTQKALQNSTQIMRDVNSLIRIPELTKTMTEMSMELTKAGVMEEMVDDMMPNDELLEGEDEEADAEVDKVLSDILGDKLPTTEAKVDELPAHHVEEDEEEDQEEILAQMRGRLEALKS
jgi:charged multivesicular body protein 3